MNIQSKNKYENQNEDDSLIIGKSTDIEIYNNSGTKLDLSVCKEEIKIMKYIGDLEKLDLETAQIFSNNGIDVFNAADDFFNDICHPFDNPFNKDITINDRRNDIYQNTSFCQDGCRYGGMNYNLMTANCLCNSSLIQEDSDFIDSEKDKINFKTLSNVFIANLFKFNYEVVKCYKLVINIKYLIHNIGFYSFSAMLLSQIIFIIIYLVKSVKSLRIFMRKFQNKNGMTNIRRRNLNIINIFGGNYRNKNKKSKFKLKATPPTRRKITVKSSKQNKILLNNLKELRVNNQNKKGLNKNIDVLNNQSQPSSGTKINSTNNMLNFLILL